MDRQGLILTLGRRHTVVLTKDHDYLKIRRQPSHVPGQTIWFSPLDVIASPFIREGFTMKKNTLVWAVALVMVVAVGTLLALPGLLPLTKKPAETTAAQTQMGVTESAGSTSLSAEPAALVLTVEINPAVDLYVSASDKVVKVVALNDAAETLALDQVLGLPADEAVAKIIELAATAGFIETADEQADYVVLTECPLAIGAGDPVEPLLEQIRSRIQNRIRNNEKLQTVELAMLRATEQNRIAAQQENIGVGLKLLNQRAEQAGLGRAESIRAYFANQERLQLANREGLMLQRQAGNGTPDGTQATSGDGAPTSPGGNGSTTQSGKN